ncbi:hypothetical protein EZV62_020586 [Acer yangbiense]|uniref:Uncharacterized protein n=1 Tax=Acer yangbiense TaxID=1000413 RepID=A0A5C7HE82_9ROSI|nr:hypothetical protein EZV62_020586 [Acer yangbiense]
MRTLSKGTLFAPDLLVAHGDSDLRRSFGSYNVFGVATVVAFETEMQTTSSPNKKKLHAGRDSADVTIPEEVEATNNGVPKGGKNISAGFSFADKSKVLRSWSLMPSTGIAGIAAHVIEQEVEIEDEKFEEVEMDSSRVKKGAINAALRNEDAI